MVAASASTRFRPPGIFSTCDKTSGDFVCFIWTAAHPAGTNFCLSEPPCAEASPALQDDYDVRRGSLFSQSCVQIGAALRQAAAARFVQDSVDDSLAIRVLIWRNSASQAPDIPDLPLYHTP
jgi:hypothetical protein